MAIRSFSDSKTQLLFESGRVGKGTPWIGVKKIAIKKLDMLDYAADLLDLKSPPGNRLEKLSGDLSGCCSIRINDQWRIIFRWTSLGPGDVKITDYH